MGEWSNVKQTTSRSRQGTFNLIAPTYDATLAPDAQIAWNRVPDAAWYEIRILDARDFYLVADTSVVGDTTYTPVGLKKDQTYYLRIDVYEGEHQQKGQYITQFSTGDTSEPIAFEDDVVPPSFELGQNYPNPFNSTTLLTYTVGRPAHVEVVLFDLLGRTVMTLDAGARPAGVHSVRVDLSGLPSGTYFYRMQADDFSAVRTMTLVR